MKPDRPEIVTVVNSCVVLIHDDEPRFDYGPPCGHRDSPSVPKRNADGLVEYVCYECVADPIHKRINERAKRHESPHGK